MSQALGSGATATTAAASRELRLLFRRELRRIAQQIPLPAVEARLRRDLGRRVC